MSTHSASGARSRASGGTGRPPKAPKPPTATQREAVAHERLGLTNKASARAALAEAAAEEAARNPAFAARVRELYEQQAAAQARSSGARGQREELPPLVPIHRVEGAHRRDPFAPPDPAYLVQVYGKDQLARALQGYTVYSLKQTAEAIERRHPGTKPKNRGRRDDLIAYIVEQTAKENAG